MSQEKVLEASLIKRIATDYWEGLVNLKDCPREIWVTYIVKVMEGLCYFSSVLVLMPFLINDMGMSDIKAGTIFGLFSASMSLFMLFVGFVADSLGIKKAFIVGLLIALVGRAMISFTLNPYVIYLGLFLLSIGFAYMIPLIPAAIKFYTTKKAQKFAYSWYYVIMNVGALVAGLSRDWLKGTFTEALEFNVFGFAFSVTPYQTIFFVAVIATLVSLFVVVFFIREQVPASAFKGESSHDADERANEEKRIEKEKKEGSTVGKRTAWDVMLEVCREKQFWIFIIFIFILVLVKMIFQYNHSLYPVYMERIGLDNWTGKLYAINPLIIIFLVPVMTAITARMRPYNVIIWGSFISAISVFFMGIAEAIMWIVMFQIVLSIGEAIYSPVIYEYTARIAPKGKEASYMAYSKAPMFFAKVAAGPLTGLLLYHLCPAEGERNTELMWILVGLSTMISPVILMFTRKWLDIEYKKKSIK